MWPSYLEFISPFEKSAEDVVVPDSSLVEKYSAPPSNKNIKTVSETAETEEQSFTIRGKNYVAQINNVGGGSIVSYALSKHLKKTEESLNLIDAYNSKNLVISFVNQSGEVVFLDNNWSLVSGKSVELSESYQEASFVFATEYLGKSITKELVFTFDSYEVDLFVSLRNLKDISLDGKIHPVLGRRPA